MKVQLRSIMGEERKQEYDVQTIHFDWGWIAIDGDVLQVSLLDLDKVTIELKGTPRISDYLHIVDKVDSVQK